MERYKIILITNGSDSNPLEMKLLSINMIIVLLTIASS